MSERAEERRRREYGGKASRVKDSYGYEEGDLSTGRVKTARLRRKSRAVKAGETFDGAASLAAILGGSAQGFSFNSADDLDRAGMFEGILPGGGSGTNRFEDIRREAPISFEVGRTLGSLVNPVNLVTGGFALRGSKGPVSAAVNKVMKQPLFAAASGATQGALYGGGGGDEETGGYDRLANAVTGAGLGAVMPYLLAPVVRATTGAVGSGGYAIPSRAFDLDGNPLPGMRVGGRLGGGQEIRLRPGVKPRDVANAVLDARARNAGGPGTLPTGRAGDVQSGIEEEILGRLTGLRAREDVPVMRRVAMERDGYSGQIDEQLSLPGAPLRSEPGPRDQATIDRARGLIVAAEGGDERAMTDFRRLWRGDGKRTVTDTEQMVDGTPQPAKKGRTVNAYDDELKRVQKELIALRRAATSKRTSKAKRAQLDEQIAENLRRQDELARTAPTLRDSRVTPDQPGNASPIRTQTSTREVAGAGLTPAEQAELRAMRLRPLTRQQEFADRGALEGRFLTDGGRRVSAIMEGDDGGIDLTRTIANAPRTERGRAMRAMDATLFDENEGGMMLSMSGRPVPAGRDRGLSGRDRRLTDLGDAAEERDQRPVRLNRAQAKRISAAMIDEQDTRALGSEAQPSARLEDLFEVGANRSLPRDFWNVADPSLTLVAKKLKAPITMNLEALLRGEGLSQALREVKPFKDTELLDGTYGLPMAKTGIAPGQSEYGDGVGFLDGEAVQFDPEDYERWRNEAELQDAYQARRPEVEAQDARPEVMKARAGAKRLEQLTRSAEKAVRTAQSQVNAASARFRQAKAQFGPDSEQAAAAKAALNTAARARQLADQALLEVEARNPELVAMRDALATYDNLAAEFRATAMRDPAPPRLKGAR